MNNNSVVRYADHLENPILYRIAAGLRIASLIWIGLAIIYVVGRLDSLSLGPWASVRVAASIIGPGALGVLLSLIVEGVRFSDRDA
jgi:hypothetical protein